ncbi:glutamate receptor ionotropic, delta-1-like [Panulirus ornatus]|uniref:glutamate receptor ionotropic, delta-1-like n=1 Tax=Panulirus ornatus TaxID=150431 RepID=UPI003A8B0D17
MSVVVWGVILYLLQRAWRVVSEGRGVSFNTALLYGWGSLLEHPPPDPSRNMSGRVMVAWWLLFCLIISTGFRSSLIAHLTVQGTTEPLDSFEDLLKQDDWQWAIEPWLYKGATLEYFSKHTSAVVQKISREMEVLIADQALKKVSEGRFSLIDHMNYISVYVASWYTDASGNTPFYVSNKGISVLAAFGWGLRKGAPFYRSFSEVMHRLEDAGVIRYWTKDVIARRVRENREDAAHYPRAGWLPSSKITEARDYDSPVYGSLEHIQQDESKLGGVSQDVYQPHCEGKAAAACSL